MALDTSYCLSLRLMSTSSTALKASSGIVGDLCTASQRELVEMVDLRYNLLGKHNLDAFFSVPFASDLPIAACLYDEHAAGAGPQLVHPQLSLPGFCSPYFVNPPRTKVDGESVAVLLTRYYQSTFHLLPGPALPIPLLQHHVRGVQHKPSVLPPFHYIGELAQLSLNFSHHQF